MPFPRSDQGTTTTPLTFREPSPLAEWVQAFITARRAENKSPGTVRFYRIKLGNFASYCDKRSVSSVEDVTPDLLRQYLLYLADAGHNPGGVYAHYRAAKAFLRWYETEAEPDAWRNPARKGKAPKVPETALEPVPQDHMHALLRACAGGRQAARDRAILLTLIDTGLRASELTALDLRDLDPITGTLTVRQGKGGKTRWVFLGHKARLAVRRWLRVRQTTTPALFTSEAGGRLTYWGLRQVMRRLAERAGIPEPPLHAFRRAFTLTMLRNGCDLLTLQRLLGHADLSLLKRYAKQSTDDLRQRHAQLSPADHMGL